MSALLAVLAAALLFSAVALLAAKVFLKRSWRETLAWLFEFFS